MSDDDPYRTVDCWVKAVRDASVLIVIGDDAIEQRWVPRSLLHGADDGDLKDLQGRADPCRLRIREWFCKKENIE